MTFARACFGRARAALALTLACVFGVAIATVRAGAQSPDAEIEPIRLEYHATAGCPTEADFAARLRAHTTKFRIASATEKARTVVIDIALTLQGADGRLSLRDVSGASDVRSLKGATCTEVMQGLALMAALAIDPSATVSVPVSASAPISASASASVSASVSAPVSVSASASASGPRVSASVSGSSPRFSAGAAGEIVSGLSPRALFGGNVFFELAIDRPTIVSPSFRFALHADAGASITTDVGAARFARFVATLDACPLSFPAPPSTIALRPCAQLGGGFVQGVGSDIVDARTARKPWLFVAALARAAWSPTPTLRIELSGGAAIPFTRYRFRFEPATSLYETARIAGFAELGVAFSF